MQVGEILEEKRGRNGCTVGRGCRWNLVDRVVGGRGDVKCIVRWVIGKARWSKNQGCRIETVIKALREHQRGRTDFGSGVGYVKARHRAA
jgi:hypothetical protein